MKKKALLGTVLGLSVLLGGCVSAPDENLELHFINKDGEVGRAIKIDEFDSRDDSTIMYRIGDKHYFMRNVPFVIEGEVDND